MSTFEGFEETNALDSEALRKTTASEYEDLNKT